uniref:Uncharacterized protein n=1 Tax=Candidatus Kentrum sp. FW TaxID=2126338 RepID=A0A450SCM9_9GAMM|nr:MAG: hypothetical protein BECKFW1821B_GA0114236_100635 [Candidatus Kentron sp. FW]
MNTTKPVCQFRILVVEDQEKWYESMEESLEDILGGEPTRYHWDLAFHATAAKEKVATEHYHFISIDQNLPERPGELVMSKIGRSLWEQFSKTQRFSFRIVYTAYGEPALGANAIRTGKAEYWEKSMTGRTRPERAIYSADGWAERIREILDREYMGYALRQGGEFLPPGIARVTRRMAGSCRVEDSPDFQVPPEKELGYLKDCLVLWESALHLAWAQAMALTQKQYADTGVVATNSETPTDREIDLGRLLPEIAKQGWLGAWGKTIGAGDPETFEGVGGRFLEQTSSPFRQLRDRLSNTFTLDSLQEEVQSSRDPLLTLLDALAFWADNPLLTHVRPVKKEQARWAAEALRGGEQPVEQMEFDASAPIETVHIPENNVFIRWQGPGKEPTLVNLSPFVTVETDENTRRPVLWIISHHRDGIWYRRSLRDGTVHPWKGIAEKERKSLEAAWG